MSLRIKIIGVFLAIVFIFALGVSLGAREILIRNLRDEMKKRGILLAKGMASRSLDLLLTENYLPLLEIFQQSLNNDSDLKYIYILDNRGSVILHTFKEGFPSDLLKVDPVKEEKYKIELLKTDEGIIEDIAVPLITNERSEFNSGTLHIGLSERSLENFIFFLTTRFIFIVFVVSLLGIIIFLVLTNFIIRPLKELTIAATKIREGNLKERVKINTKDELSLLGKTFNEMIGMIQKKVEESKNLLNKLIFAQEEERKRIARELHDETSQRLAALMIDLKLMENSSSLQEMKGRLSGIRENITMTMDGIRLLASELRPSLLDELGLIEVLKKYIKEFSSRFAINADFQPMSFQEKVLPPHIEITLYRIIQESLTNIARHSGAKNVSVILEQNKLPRSKTAGYSDRKIRKKSLLL